MQDSSPNQSTNVIPTIDSQVSGINTPLPVTATPVPQSDFINTYSSVPPRKRLGKKIISALLSMILLVGGLAAGVTLVLQPQIFKPNAQTLDSSTSCSSAGSVRCQKTATGLLTGNIEICSSDVWHSGSCPYGCSSDLNKCCPTGTYSVDGICKPVPDCQENVQCSNNSIKYSNLCKSKEGATIYCCPDDLPTIVGDSCSK